MNATEILLAARAKVEAGWCQGIYTEAMDAAGNVVDPTSDDACRWCMLGGIKAVADNYHQVHAAYEFLKQAIPSGPVAWQENPERTHSEVLAAFDRAVELSRE